MYDNLEAGLFVTTGIVFVACIIGLIVGSYKEHKQWEQFKIEHNCTVIGHMNPSVGTGIGPSTHGGVAVVVTSSSAKTGWLCDDGLQYWR